MTGEGVELVAEGVAGGSCRSALGSPDSADVQAARRTAAINATTLLAWRLWGVMPSSTDTRSNWFQKAQRDAGAASDKYPSRQASLRSLSSPSRIRSRPNSNSN